MPISVKKLFTPVLAVSMLLSSCENFKDKQNDKFDFKLKLTTNAPVKFNEELKVKVDEVFDDYRYEMTLPGNISGDLTSFHTATARFSNEGWYKIAAYGDGKPILDSVYVDVIAEPVPCSPAINTLRSNVVNIAMDFYGVGGRVSGSDQYEVDANSSSGDLNLSFGHEEKPAGNRTYITAQMSGFNSADQVSAYIVVAGGINVTYYAEAGQYVHVSEENGQTMITLCNFKMISQYGETIVNARLELD